MISSVLSLLQANDHAFPFCTHHDLVLGKLEVAHGYLVFAIPCCIENGLINKILYVCTGESRGSPCYHRKINIIRKRRLSCVHLENLFPSFYIGKRNYDLPIK